MLDARGAVSVTERVGMIKRVRDLAVACARAYVESRERLGWPLLHGAGGEAPEAPEAAAAVAGEVGDGPG